MLFFGKFCEKAIYFVCTVDAGVEELTKKTRKSENTRRDFVSFVCFVKTNFSVLG